MFIATRGRNPGVHPQMNGKQSAVHHAMEYSALKRKKMWGNLEHVLREICQAQEDKYCMIPPL